MSLLVVADYLLDMLRNYIILVLSLPPKQEQIQYLQQHRLCDAKFQHKNRRLNINVSAIKKGIGLFLPAQFAGTTSALSTA